MGLKMADKFIYLSIIVIFDKKGNKNIYWNTNSVGKASERKHLEEGGCEVSVVDFY